MALLDVDLARGTYDHVCEHCHFVQRGLPLHPDKGYLTPRRDVDGTVSCLATRPCPFVCRCPEHQGGKVCGSVELFRATIAEWETGDVAHPDSMVGHVFPDTGNVVVEHWLLGIGHHHSRKQARHILDILAHPDMAPHAAQPGPLPEASSPVLPK